MFNFLNILCATAFKNSHNYAIMHLNNAIPLVTITK